METIILDPRLTFEQQYAIRQVLANMAMSGMSPSEECIRRMEAVQLGEKTPEQAIQEMNRRYKK